MGVGIDDYKFGSKDNWRRRVWNQAKERISVKPKNAIVLYLPSKQNIDMDIAKQKGFRPENMFAVERNKNIIKYLRKQKINVIDGDFSKILLNWNGEPKIDAIMADFCCGLTYDIEFFIGSLIYSKGIKNKNTVVMCNFMRGRDNNQIILNKPIFSLYRELLKGIPTDHPMEIFKNMSTKHRGCMFYSCRLIYELTQLLINNGIYNFMEIFKFSNPLPLVYKSKNKRTRMDSIIFNWKNFLPEVCFDKQKEVFEHKKLIQKISAAKAIRTMRLSN